MSEKLLSHPAALVNIVRRIAERAGEITLDYFDESGFSGAVIKGDGSPVTAADNAAETYILKELYAVIPEIPVIGEESFAAGQAPDLSKEYFWLVDPLDGTKEFISGSGDYTVNIALMKCKGKVWQPCLGVVYAPAKGILYTGHGSGTAMRYNLETLHDKDIRVRQLPKEGLTVLASKSHGSGEKLDRYLERFKVNKRIGRGSSLKICAIAEGKADLYPRFGPTCEWDIAAAHAVLLSAGGILKAADGTDIIYGKSADKYLNPEFIAASGTFVFEDDV